MCGVLLFDLEKEEEGLYIKKEVNACMSRRRTAGRDTAKTLLVI